MLSVFVHVPIGAHAADARGKRARRCFSIHSSSGFPTSQPWCGIRAAKLSSIAACVSSGFSVRFCGL